MKKSIGDNNNNFLPTLDLLMMWTTDCACLLAMLDMRPKYYAERRDQMLPYMMQIDEIRPCGVGGFFFYFFSPVVVVLMMMVVVVQWC